MAAGMRDTNLSKFDMDALTKMLGAIEPTSISRTTLLIRVTIDNEQTAAILE